MNNGLFYHLMLNETDIDSALQRLSNNEELYVSLLVDFVDDPTMDELESAINKRDWDEAFTAAHALKGLAGNMGFIPLFHNIAELVVLIRAGKIEKIKTSLAQTKDTYNDLITVIKQNCDI